LSTFEVLLQVQERDLAIDRLRHRRDHLPERAELRTVEDRIAQVQTTLVEAMGRRDEVVDRQTKLEADVAASEKRIVEIDKRMYSGEVSASRDLQAMTDEIQSLKRRVSSLEDQALEVMEEREPLDAEVATLEQQRADLDGQAQQLLARIAEAEAAIDAELATEQAARREVATGLPADLASTYERLRSKLGGVGAARLEQGSCTGCHLKLPSTEVERLRKLDPDEVAFCDQCGRILVR
jgi:uncharacterized protein